MNPWWRNPEIWLWLTVAVVGLAVCKFGGEMLWPPRT